MKITSITARQILDSRGMPTVECRLQLDGKVDIVASVPSGASVGKYEAHELRDCDQAHFQGFGVLKAVEAIQTRITPLLMGKEPDVFRVDQELLACDGTENKTELGANGMLAVSIAVARAQAYVLGVELFELVQKLSGTPKVSLPRCMFNLINGGMHADSGLCFQEFMVMPQVRGVQSSVEEAESVYQLLKATLHEQHASTAIGDEGGFAPVFGGHGVMREYAALGLLHAATRGKIDLCLDVAASTLYDQEKKAYRVHDIEMVGEQLIDLYEKMMSVYPIVSIEDGLDQDDWEGWKVLTQRLGKRVMLIGDDLFTTNVARIQQGIASGVANAVLIKPNQIGTVSETLQAINTCKKAGYRVIVSHRSGETSDTFIADLAVGVAAYGFKAGAPVRGERVVKYNRLMEIEDLLTKRGVV